MDRIDAESRKAKPDGLHPEDRRTAGLNPAAPACTCESVSTEYECRWDPQCPRHGAPAQPKYGGVIYPTEYISPEDRERMRQALSDGIEV